MKENPNNNTILIHIPLFISLSITFAVVFFFVNAVFMRTSGVFIYPLDDPFIHMEIAKNLAFNGTWGINPGEFASASSSLLYSVILAAGFKLFGVHESIPLIINCIAAVFLLAAANKWLLKKGVSRPAVLIMLLAVVFFLPLPVMILSGMEHTLQCLFSFLFLTAFSDWIACLKEKKASVSEEKTGRGFYLLLFYAFLVTGIRYEGLFLIGAALLILLIQWRLKYFILLAMAAFLPIVFFGILSVYKGGYFFPNPLLIKTDNFEFSVRGLAEFFNNILVNKLTITKSIANEPGVPPPGISLLATQRILIIIPLVYIFFNEGARKYSASYYTLFIVLLTTVAHLVFASTGWFYRYEAYLILLSCFISFYLAYKLGVAWIRQKDIFYKAALIILVFALFFPFVLRSAAAFTKAKRACTNIYEQQYQVGQFIKKYYNSSVIAANDIGAVSFYSDARIIDLWGLGSTEIAKSRKGGYWAPSYIDSFVRANNVRIAIVYDEWFPDELLGKWKKAGTWKIYDNVITGGDTVSFYCTNDSEQQMLVENLKRFSLLLPGNIEVNYY